MTNRIRAGWNRWRETSGVICDKKVTQVLNNKIYKTAIIPAMTFDEGCWAIRQCEQKQLNTTETKMLRCMKGKPRKYISHVTIREKAGIKSINTLLIKKGLSWFGHVQRRDYDNIAKSVLNTQID